MSRWVMARMRRWAGERGGRRWRRFSSLSAWVIFKSWGGGGGREFFKDFKWVWHFWCSCKWNFNVSYTSLSYTFTSYKNQHLMYFGTIRGSGITKRRWATDGQVWLCPHYDKWVTSSGQTENNRAKCIIHGKRPSPLTVSICQPCLCRCCLTALKNPARSWKAGEEGHVDYNAAYSRVIIQLCCWHQGRGWAGEEVGGVVSERIHSPFEKNKQLYCHPKWWDTLPLEKPTSYTTAQTASKFKHFCFSSGGRTWWIKERKQLVCQKQKHFNKRK